MFAEFGQFAVCATAAIGGHRVDQLLAIAAELGAGGLEAVA